MNFRITHLESIGSTNDYLLESISNDRISKPEVLVAEEQKNGKGHGANSWESYPGKNLTFSVLIQPHFIHPADQFLLTQIVSVTLAEVLQNYLPENVLRIKWPNDIYAEEKKMAGILIQNVIQGPVLAHSVIGIGLNVNQKHFFSEAPNPISLIHFLGKETDREKLLSKILKRFFYNLENAESAVFAKEIGDYYLSILYRRNEWARFRAGQEEFEGNIEGISEYGNLQITNRSGRILEFGFKEVTYL